MILTGILRFFERKDEIVTEEIEEKPEMRKTIEVPRTKWDYFCHSLPSFLQRGRFKPKYYEMPVIWNKYIKKATYKIYDIKGIGDIERDGYIIIRQWKTDSN